MPSALLGTGFVLAAGGPILLRQGWNGPRGPVILGWAALFLALVLTLTQGGAWGLAVGCTLTSSVALILLAQAAWRTPAPVRRRAGRTPALRQSPPVTARDLARRIAIFLIVGGLDLLAALTFGWGAQRLAYVGGMVEADSLVTGLFAFPLAWLALASWQLTCTRVLDMALGALALAALGGMAWLTM